MSDAEGGRRSDGWPALGIGLAVAVLVLVVAVAGLLAIRGLTMARRPSTPEVPSREVFAAADRGEVKALRLDGDVIHGEFARPTDVAGVGRVTRFRTKVPLGAGPQVLSQLVARAPNVQVERGR